MTLPESTLAHLQAIDCDRARAIVKLAAAMMPNIGNGQKLVEVIEVTPGVGMILIAPSLYLRRIPWLRLVEIAPARFLLSMPSGTPVDSLELALIDLFDRGAAFRNQGTLHHPGPSAVDPRPAPRRQRWRKPRCCSSILQH